jgi:hypothetical protein
VISPTQSPLTDNKQHSQETDLYALGGIRTPNPSKQVAVIRTFDIHMPVHRNIIPNYSYRNATFLDLEMVLVPSLPR